MVDVLQCGSRALCNSQDDALFVIMYEHWVHDISLDEFNEGNLGDPDHPRAKLKSSSQQRECVPLSCLRLVKSPTCIQSQFATYLDDTSTAGTTVDSQ